MSRCTACGRVARSYSSAEELLRGLSTSHIKEPVPVGQDIPDIPIPLTDAWKAFLATYGDGQVPISGSPVEVGEPIKIVVNLETLLGLNSSDKVPGESRVAAFNIDLEPRGTNQDIGYFGSQTNIDWYNGNAAYNGGRWEILGVEVRSQDTDTVDPQATSRLLRVTLNQVLDKGTPDERERYMASAVYGEYGTDTPFVMAPEVTGKDAVGGELRGMSVYVPVVGRGAQFIGDRRFVNKSFVTLSCYVTQLWSGDNVPEPNVRNLAVRWWMRMYPPGK